MIYNIENLAENNLMICYLGYCNIFADVLYNYIYESILKKEDNDVLFYTERAYSYNPDAPENKNVVGYMHEYVVAEYASTKYYLDIRGVYDDFESFIQDIIRYNNKEYNKQLTINDIHQKMIRTKEMGMFSPDDIVLFWDEPERESAFSKSCGTVTKHGQEYLDELFSLIRKHNNIYNY